MNELNPTPDLTYVFRDSPFGRLLIAATENGVCYAALGQDDAELLLGLLADFPNACPEESQPVSGWADALAAYLSASVSASAPDPEIPLDLRGTPFQHTVWDALRRIPRGETRTYASLAEMIGRPPQSARAVGLACGSNRVALLVPCHRVIRADGNLGGYRWGIERKQALLAWEARRR